VGIRMDVHAAFRLGRWDSGVRGVSAFVSGARVLLCSGSLALGRGTFALSGIGVSGHWRWGFGVGVLVFEHLGVGGCSGVRELAGVGVHALRRAFERSQVRWTASYEGVGAAHRPGVPAVCWLWLHSSFVLARSTLRRHCVGHLGSLHGSKEGAGQW